MSMGIIPVLAQDTGSGDTGSTDNGGTSMSFTASQSNNGGSSPPGNGDQGGTGGGEVEVVATLAIRTPTRSVEYLQSAAPDR
jgi:hypothetical protein